MKIPYALLSLALAGCQAAAPAPVLPPARPAPETRPVAVSAPVQAAPSLEQKVRQQAQYIEALISQNDALAAKLAAPAAPPAVTAVSPPSPLPLTPPPAVPVPAATTEPFLMPNAEGVIDLTAVAAEARPGEPVNPFAVRIASPDAEHEVTIHVSGILGGSVPCAVINDRPVQAGDSVESFTVERIESDAVWLRHAGQRLRLPVAEKPVHVRLPL